MKQQRISIDTRTIQPGDAFIPIGQGINFTDEAISKGATILDVDLTDYAKKHRSLFSGHVIAVIGSFGKTTLKDYLAATLSPLGISATEKNFNNEIGVPLTIANAKLSDHAWIIECGIRKPGDMIFLRDIVQPTMIVFSGFGYSHMEFYDSELELLNEKLSIISTQTKHVFLPSSIRYYQNILTILNHHSSITTHTIQVKRLIDCPFVMTQSIADFFHTSTLSKDALLNTHSPHRLKEYPLNKGISLIDDSYNSNPIAVQYAVETLLSKYTSNQLILVLGDMLELGDQSVQLHGDTIEWCKQQSIKTILTFGQLFETSTNNFVSHDHLTQHLISVIKPNQKILIKGSRSNSLDNVVQNLIHHLNRVS